MALTLYLIWSVRLTIAPERQQGQRASELLQRQSMAPEGNGRQTRGQGSKVPKYQAVSSKEVSLRDLEPQ